MSSQVKEHLRTQDTPSKPTPGRWIQAQMVPTIRAFMDAHRLPDVTVVADAGMISAGNQKAIEEAGLSFILGARISDVPYVVAQWRREHPG